MTEDEVVGWHHQLNGHEFEHALGDGESDSTEQLNNSYTSSCVFFFKQWQE